MKTINKTSTHSLSVIAAALVALSTVALPTSVSFAQDRFANVEVKATPIKGAVHMLTGMGGNIGVSAGDDGVLIIAVSYTHLTLPTKRIV